MTFVFAVAARIYIWPHLNVLEARSILIPILLLHATRHFGMMFLAPGATYPGLPQQFAYPAAFGDLLTAILAIVAIVALTTNAKSSRMFVWIFNIAGSLDLIAAIALATLYDASPFMGAAYWIPAFWVPALLVTHYITFVVMIKYWRKSNNS